MTLKPTAEMRAALKDVACCDCRHDEALANLLAIIDRERSGGDAMYKAAYFGVNEVLDAALGTEEEDGAGEGLVADVMLLAHRYELALKALEAAGAQLVAAGIRRAQLPEEAEPR